MILDEISPAKDEMIQSSDRFSLSVEAFIHISKWHGQYAWLEQDERIDKAIGLAYQAGAVSKIKEVPKLLERDNRLVFAFLSGLPKELKPDPAKYFTVTKEYDRVYIAPRSEYGSGSMCILRRNNTESWLKHLPYVYSYKGYLYSDDPTEVKRGLYFNDLQDYDDIRPESDFSLKYANDDCGEIEFGKAEAIQPSYPEYFVTYKIEYETLLMLSALREIFQSGLFKERTQEELDEIGERAISIKKKAIQPCFLPIGGICYSCKSDVTRSHYLMDDPGSITGCHICARSWCD